MNWHILYHFGNKFLLLFMLLSHANWVKKSYFQVYIRSGLHSRAGFLERGWRNPVGRDMNGEEGDWALGCVSTQI